MTSHEELRAELIDLLESLRHNPDCNTCEGCQHLTKVKAKILRMVGQLEAENAKFKDKVLGYEPAILGMNQKINKLEIENAALKSELNDLFSNNTTEWKSAAFQKIKGLEQLLQKAERALEPFARLADEEMPKATKAITDRMPVWKNAKQVLTEIRENQRGEI